jgi:hypothetical protein
MTTPYDEEFFALHSGSSRSSAQVVLAPVLECLRPESLVDVGGGIGEWASVAKELGVAEVLVVDGDYVDQSQLHVNTSEFLPNDLGVSLNLPRRFDLALSLEVAEHLSATRAESFIRDLSYLTDAVLFSAAVPGQGGTAHVNERWQNYWAGLFSAKGFEVFDVVRSAIWYDDRVSFWYRQNTFLFARGDSAISFAISRDLSCLSTLFTLNLCRKCLDVSQSRCVSERQPGRSVAHYWVPLTTDWVEPGTARRLHPRFRCHNVPFAAP